MPRLINNQSEPISVGQRIVVALSIFEIEILIPMVSSERSSSDLSEYIYPTSD